MPFLTNEDIKIIELLREKITGTSTNGDAKFELLLNNIEQLIINTGCDNFISYLNITNKDAHELKKLISALTVHTTWLFREAQHFNLLETSLLSSLRQKSGINFKTIDFHLLVAGCSNGAEVYSYALVLENIRRQFKQFDYTIYGFDIDSVNVHKAKMGIFDKRDSTRVPEKYRTLLKNYEENQITLVSDILRRCTLETRNILEVGNIAANFDWVSCRNVLLYFSDILREKIAQDLVARLNPGGVFCIGLCENLKISKLDVKEVSHSAFRKNGKSGTNLNFENDKLNDKYSDSLTQNTKNKNSEIKYEATKNSFHQINQMQQFDLLLIGSSTGGTQVLTEMLKDIPPEFPPIVIVQHMSSNFSADFSKRLATIAGLTLGIAENGVPLEHGCLYMASDDYHIGVKMLSGVLSLMISKEAAWNGYRPSVNYLFNSACALPVHVAAALLTGMGNDGAEGLLALKNRGATTLVQNAESCVVFGMPKEAIDIGAATFIGTPKEIRQQLNAMHLLTKK